MDPNSVPPINLSTVAFCFGINDPVFENRIAKLRQPFEELGIDSYLVTDPIDVTYLCGFTGDSSLLWVGSDAIVLLSDGRFETQIRDQCPDLDAAIRQPQTAMHQWVAQVHSHDRFGKRVGFQSEHLTVAAFEAFASNESIQWTPTTGVIGRLRMIKDRREIEQIRESIVVAEQTLETVCFSNGNFSFDGTERELAFAIESEIRRRGGSGTSFEPIVARDAAGALPHYQPSDIAIAGSTTLLIDWGAMVGGYASDLTRTFHSGDAGPDFERAYGAVHAAHDAAVAAAVVGATAGQVDAAARDCLAQCGWGDYFLHSTGHGFGMQVHEAPRIAAGQDVELQSGMVITIEPGVYLADRFGIRLENDILVAADGPQSLSTAFPLGLEQSAKIG